MHIRFMNRLLAAALVTGLAVAASAPASAQPSSRAATTAPAQVSLNTATVEELTQLPGIGPSRARAIVERREHRPFRRVEEVMLVRGIGRATFARLRPLLSVDGAPPVAARLPAARHR